MLFALKPDADKVSLLADHLEDVLEAAEALLHCRFSGMPVTAETSAETLLDRLAALRTFANRVSVLELGLTARLNQARAIVRKFAKGDANIRTFANLFLAGTNAIVDQVPLLQDVAGQQFTHANDAVPFLERRRVIDPVTQSVDAIEELTPGENYLVFGVAPLTPLIELCESFLNALDAHFGLYQENEDTVSVLEPAASAEVPVIDLAAPVASEGPVSEVSMEAPISLVDRLNLVSST